jgi:hypothetical protein
MPAIGRGPVNPPSPRKMTNRGLIDAIIVFHLIALPFIIIAICQIRLEPGRLSSYAALIPVVLLLGEAYMNYLAELLRRRREKK